MIKNGRVECDENDIVSIMTTKCQYFNPTLIFLLGINYAKFKDNYKPMSFYELGLIIQERIDANKLTPIELNRTFSHLLTQDSLDSVFDLMWLKRFRAKFEENNEEVSLIRREVIPNNVGNGAPHIPVPRVNQRVEQPMPSYPDINDFAMPVPPDQLMQREIDYSAQPVYAINKEDGFGSDSDAEEDELERLRQLQEQEERELAEAERKRKEEEEAKSMRFIEFLMKEEEKDAERKRVEEQINLLAIRKLEEQEAKELEERKRKEAAANKPECKVCYDNIDFVDIYPLSCGHIFHPHCLAPHISAKVENKTFPIECPDCRVEMDEAEVRHFSEPDVYEKLVKFQFELFVEQNNDLFLNCPTPDCKFVFEWNGDKQNQKFNCKICKNEYCIFCRVKWHEGLTCTEYRELNGYPPEDRAFYKFIKGTKFKQCPKCKFWVEKTEGCDHMTCRCKYEFCYKCGGKYRACECCKKR